MGGEEVSEGGNAMDLTDYMHISRLKEKLNDAVARHGSLKHPEVLGISRRIDRVAVEITEREYGGE